MKIEQLKWRCRRGMLELDILLLRYLENHYAKADPEEQSLFCELLALPDPELYACLMGSEESRDPRHEPIIKAVHIQSRETSI